MVIHTYIKEKKDEQLNHTYTTEQSRAEQSRAEQSRAERNMRLLYRGSAATAAGTALLMMPYGGWVERRADHRLIKNNRTPGI